MMPVLKLLRKWVLGLRVLGVSQNLRFLTSVLGWILSFPLAGWVFMYSCTFSRVGRVSIHETYFAPHPFPSSAPEG
jgi:hypothetical protein